MTYKTILVQVDAEKHCAARLATAIALARRFDAHLIGLHVHEAVLLPAYVAAEPFLNELRQRAAAQEAQEAQATFSAAMSSAGLASHEWRSVHANMVDTLLLHARYADLLVVGQQEPGAAWGGGPEFVDQVLLAAGRPVLVVPYAGSFDDTGNRILVGWNASREAARAVTDAIPLLRGAAAVKIIVIRPRAGEHADIPGADIGLYLARHGVRVEVTRDEPGTIDIGNEILSRAADFGADLIVMGAYGHSRLRQLVMGGATRTIMDSMTVPVLLSH